MTGKIHILGAAGSGTSTLGDSLSKVLPHKHLDTDHYFWISQFTEQRQVIERKKMLNKDLSLYEKWILSDAVCGWGTTLNPILTWLYFYGSQKTLGSRDYNRENFKGMEMKY